MAMPTIFLLHPSMVLVITHHEVLCYCSLAKPDIKQGWQKLVLNLSWLALLFICAPRSLVTPRSHNLISNLH